MKKHANQSAPKQHDPAAPFVAELWRRMTERYSKEHISAANIMGAIDAGKAGRR